MSTKSIRKRFKRPKREGLELDITSLLDILVIILIFLLKNYNTSDIQIDIPKDIKPPLSKSQLGRNVAPVVGLSASKVYLNDEVIVDLSSANKKQFDHGGLRILPLYNQLMELKEKGEVQRLVHPKMRPNKSVNLVVDRDVTYKWIRKVMYTCERAGLNKYKFIVYQDEKHIASSE